MEKLSREIIIKWDGFLKNHDTVLYMISVGFGLLRTRLVMKNGYCKILFI